MVNGMNRQEDSKNLEVAQNEINMEREKEALDSIQSQANVLDKYLEGKSEPRFSFMKYLRRDKNREPQSNDTDIEAPSTSGAGPGLDDNGLPSYSEATMDSLTLEDSLVGSKMVDGATQTMGEAEDNSEESKEPELEDVNTVTDTENKTENANPRRFRFFNFTNK